MSAIVLLSVLFALAFGQAASFCIPTEYTMYVDRRECAYCLAINTTICAGYCMTRVCCSLYFFSYKLHRPKVIC